MSTTPRLPSAIEGLAPAFPATLYPHRPEMFETFRDMYGTFWSRGELDHPTKEVARLHNARRTDCGVCRNIRFARARAEGLNEETIDLIDDGYDSSGLSDRYKAVLSFVDAFLDATAPPPETQAELQHEMTDAQVVELAFGLSVFHGFAKMLIVLGCEPESMPTTVADTPDLGYNWRERKEIPQPERDNATAPV